MSENRGGNQANLNGDLLNSLEVPAPDMEIQKELALKKIESCFNRIECHGEQLESYA